MATVVMAAEHVVVVRRVMTGEVNETSLSRPCSAWGRVAVCVLAAALASCVLGKSQLIIHFIH